MSKLVLTNNITVGALQHIEERQTLTCHAFAEILRSGRDQIKAFTARQSFLYRSVSNRKASHTHPSNAALHWSSPFKVILYFDFKDGLIVCQWL